MHAYIMNGTEVIESLPQGKYFKAAKPESEMFIMAFGGITVLGMLLVLWKGLRKQKRNPYQQIYA